MEPIPGGRERALSREELRDREEVAQLAAFAAKDDQMDSLLEKMTKSKLQRSGAAWEPTANPKVTRYYDTDDDDDYIEVEEIALDDDQVNQLRASPASRAPSATPHPPTPSSPSLPSRSFFVHPEDDGSGRRARHDHFETLFSARLRHVRDWKREWNEDVVAAAIDKCRRVRDRSRSRSRERMFVEDEECRSDDADDRDRARLNADFESKLALPPVRF